jgi:hypothetical protein
VRLRPRRRKARRQSRDQPAAKLVPPLQYGRPASRTWLPRPARINQPLNQ